MQRAAFSAIWMRVFGVDSRTFTRRYAIRRCACRGAGGCAGWKIFTVEDADVVTLLGYPKAVPHWAGAGLPQKVTDDPDLFERLRRLYFGETH